VSRPPVLALTGHRGLPPGAPVLIRQQLEELVRLYPSATWLSGGAVGVDQVAAQALLALGQRVEFVLPFPIDIQSARWSTAQRETLRFLVTRAAAVEVLATRYHVTGYHIRNRRLLERADVLVAFTDGRSTGGTASVIREARRREMPVLAPAPAPLRSHLESRFVRNARCPGGRSVLSQAECAHARASRSPHRLLER